jgi:acetyl esterase/lipase
MPKLSRAALLKGLLASAAAVLVFGASAVAAGDASEPILLWPNGAPGPKAAPGPEAVRLSPQGEHIVTNITAPSIIPYLPAPGTATGVAVVVAPGGGHTELWMDHEGYRVGQWLSAHGIAAFVLKYRLSKQPGSPYSLEGDSLGDIQRAIRLVRSRSAEWHVDPKKVGVMGFSAGGELAALAGWRDAVISGGSDPVDAQSVRPDFEALIYPGIPSHGAFSAATPPTFLLAGDKDSPKVSEGVADLYLQIHRAGGSAEVHILAGVGHGFGMRDSNSAAIKAWPQMFHDWLEAQGFIAAPAAGH